MGSCAVGDCGGLGSNTIVLVSTGAFGLTDCQFDGCALGQFCHCTLKSVKWCIAASLGGFGLLDFVARGT